MNAPAAPLVARLRAEIADLKDKLEAADEYKRDAERYWWLRDVGDSTWRPLVARSRLAFPHVPQHELAPMIDEIINAAIDDAKEEKA